MLVYYNFDETSGNLINQCSNLTATSCLSQATTNGVLDGVTQANTTSVFGFSYYLDGVNDEIETTGTTATFPFLGNGTSWTWVMWVHPNDLASDMVLWSDWSGSGDIGTGSTNFQDNPADNIRAVMQGATGRQLSVNGLSMAGTFNDWHMLAFRYNYPAGADNYNATLDNSDTFTATRTNTATTGNTPAVMQFGELVSFNFWNYEGNYDEWSIWDRLLTNEELLELYNNGAGMKLTPDVSAPENLTATAISEFQINLDWDHVLDGGTNGFRIFRESPVGGGWSTLVSNTTNTNTEYSNTGLTCDTEYNYMVAALTSFGTISANSTAASATTSACGANTVTFWNWRVNEPLADRLGGVLAQDCSSSEVMVGINHDGSPNCVDVVVPVGNFTGDLNMNQYQIYNASQHSINADKDQGHQLFVQCENGQTAACIELGYGTADSRFNITGSNITPNRYGSYIGNTTGSENGTNPTFRLFGGRLNSTSNSNVIYHGIGLDFHGGHNGTVQSEGGIWIGGVDSYGSGSAFGMHSEIHIHKDPYSAARARAGLYTIEQDVPIGGFSRGLEVASTGTERATTGVLISGNWTDMLDIRQETGGNAFTVEGDGDLIMSPTKRFYLDDGTHTWISETAADDVRIIVGNQIGLRLDETGNWVDVILGKQTVVPTTNDNGFVFIPYMNGAPTGTPAGFAGKLGMIYDLTNNDLCIYNTTAWNCKSWFP